MLKTEISPELQISDAIKVILGRQYKQMKSREDGTLKGEDAEELHQMRVATRKMRAALVLIEPIIIRKVYRQLMKGLRFVGRNLGAVRDLDVFYESIEEIKEEGLISEGDGLRVMELTEKQIAYQRIKMTQSLIDTRYIALKDLLNTFLNYSEYGIKAKAFEAPGKYLVKSILPVTLLKQLGIVQELGKQVNYLDIDALHELRIEIKKLRYTLEFFRQVLGQEVIKKIVLLKEAQDFLGTLNDMSVALGTLPGIFDQGNKLTLDHELQIKMHGIFDTKRKQSVVDFPVFWEMGFEDQYWADLEDMIMVI